MENYNFKVNLKGVIDILSNHLYSSPDVFIREVLQNCVDAITARSKESQEYEGSIIVELYDSTDIKTLYIEDNGIGLTEEEVHMFLSEIGRSSKRESTSEQDFIGRFGIGLLSCFIVSEEIVLITKSVHSHETIEWRGKSDGSYTIKKLKDLNSTGTRIYLRSKKESEEFFEYEKIKSALEKYGSFLPYLIHLKKGETSISINKQKAPWEMTLENALYFGKSKYNIDFLDAIPIHSTIGGADGIVYILPYKVSLNAKKKHQVYVKRMMMSNKMEGILPDWAFFVTGIININNLNLTVSRESFHDEDMLDVVKDELGECIKKYFIQLSLFNPSLLQRIISIHYSSIKALAVEDDELFTLFINLLPFTTSFGNLTMGEIRNRETIYYTTTLDEFRQISKVAKAQGLCVINGGYVHDLELVEKMAELFPDIEMIKIDPTDIKDTFEELSLQDRLEVYEFIKFADVCLQTFKCSADIKRFSPSDLPVLYTSDEDMNFLRSAQQTKGQSNELFASIIDDISQNITATSFSQLCFNYNNPLIQKIIESREKQLQSLTIEMLYVQALLMGNQPLNPAEYKLLNSGLLNLIEYAAERK